MEYFKETNNTQLSSLSRLDQEEVLKSLQKELLVLRESINTSEKDTFGLEIEFERGTDKKLLYELGDILVPKDFFLDNQHYWCIDEEFDIYHQNTKCKWEINSPVLIDNKENWITLEYILEKVKNYSRIGQDCGGHINAGAQILGSSVESWENFLNIYATYENVINRFLYGEYLTPRKSLNHFAPPVANSFLKQYNYVKKYNVSYYFDVIFNIYKTKEKFHGVSFEKVFCENMKDHNVVEFRTPNGSLDPVIWQNNVNFIIKLLKYCSNKDFNYDVINNRKKKNDLKTINRRTLVTYNRIYRDSAIELADLIFDNDLDKCYFLRQYFKNFKVGLRNMERVQKFTKKLL